VQQVGGFVGHEEFRTVGGAQDQRTGGPQPRNHLGILARHIALMQQAADLAFVTGCGNGTLHRHRQTMQRAAFGGWSLIHEERLGPHPLGVEVREGVEVGVEPINLLDVRLGQLGYRHFAGAQHFQLPHRRGKN